MNTAYFLGAGASAADGIPVTSQLNCGVAAWLNDADGEARELRTYYEELYSVTETQLDEIGGRWKKFLNDRTTGGHLEQSVLPNLVETLSLMDVCISEEHSLGMSMLREHGRRVEMNPSFLRSARQQLTRGVAIAVNDASRGQHAPLNRRLVDAMGPGDVIISTNWDMLLDRCVVQACCGEGAVAESPIRYHCVGERPVNWKGEDVAPACATAQSLLRLHGGLNWFGCPCCGTVYVNLEGGWVMDAGNRRPGYDECECGAGLLNVMIAPSFLKDYRSVSLRSVWREAQKRLEAAERWVFIGYSLPSDDFHIRAMLMRALRSRGSTRRNPVDIHAYLGPESDEALRRYKDLFRVSPPKVEMSGLQGWLEWRAREGTA